MNYFVSRGGIKLQAAIINFQLSIVNLTCLDVGSSTGGFVDCLLQNGAKKVYAVDTAYGELAWKLRNDPRVVVMERTNILHMQHLRGEATDAASRAHLGGGEKVDLITMPEYVESVKEKTVRTINDLPAGKAGLRFTINEIMESPILGVGGNREFLLLLRV